MAEAKLIYLNPHVKDSEHMGLQIIASVLEANGMKYQLHFLSELKDEAALITAEAAIYGFYLSLDNYDLVCTLARKIKAANPDNLIVLGGVLASSAAESILAENLDFDYVVIGDGEYTFLHLVQAFPDKERISAIPGVYSRERQIVQHAESVDIAALPPMNRDLLEKNLLLKNYWARVYTNRKCFGNCSFCCVNYDDAKSRPSRQFSERRVDDVVAEMTALTEKYGVRCFIFNDASLEDSYQSPRNKIMEFCQKVIASGLKAALFSNFRAETLKVDDPLLLEAMKAAGFVQVFLGIESNTPAELKLYKKRASVNDNHSALANLQKYNIRTHLGYIMLNPYSTVETLETNYNFLVEIKRWMLTNYVSQLVPYYKTPIYHKMLEEGLLKADYSFKHPENFNYANDYAAKVAEVLQKTVYASSLLSFDDELTNYEKLLLYLDRIHDGQYAGEMAELDSLQTEVALLNRDYFKLLYKDKELEKAYQQFTQYETEIMGCQRKLSNIKLRMMKKRKITNFIL